MSMHRRAIALALSLLALLPAAGASANVFNLTNRAPLPVPVLQEMERLEAEKGPFRKWSLEDKAMSESLDLDEGLEIDIPDDPIHTLPAEGDLPEADALAIAKEAIVARYLVKADKLDSFDVYTAFILRPETGITYWAFDLYPEIIGADGRYHVEVSAAAGEVAKISWTFIDFWSAAAALAEAGKTDALLEHIGDETFRTLPLRDKALYSDALRGAGHSPFAGGYFHVMPEESELSEMDAIEAARETVKERFGFTDKVLEAIVETAVSFMETPDGARVWVIEFTPTPYRDQYGTYRVEIGASAGDVRSASWSLANVYDASAPVDDLSGPILNAEQLGLLLDLTEEHSRLQAEMEAALGPFDTWSLEDKAKLSAVWREKGHPKPDMILNDLPGEGDMAEKEAIQAAREALMQKFGVEAETLDKFTVYSAFLRMPYGLEAVWDFQLVPRDYADIDLGEYRVSITSPSGTIEYCDHYIEVGYLAPLPPEDPDAAG